VRTEVIHHHHVVRAQLRAQNLVQIAPEDVAVGRLRDGHGGEDAAGAHGAQDGQDFPVALGRALGDARPTHTAGIAARHLRGNAAFIQENQLLRRNVAEGLDELLASFAVGFRVAFLGVE
jgi:hypothetical protein